MIGKMPKIFIIQSNYSPVTSPMQTNKQLITEFVWNITQTDPDDPLVVSHYGRLLALLTQV
jgi:hypothetical protein